MVGGWGWVMRLMEEMGEEYTSGDIMMKDLQLSETWVRMWGGRC